MFCVTEHRQVYIHLSNKHWSIQSFQVWTLTTGYYTVYRGKEDCRCKDLQETQAVLWISSVMSGFLIFVLQFFRGIQSLLFHPSNSAIFFIFLYCPCLFLMRLWAAMSLCDERRLQIQDTKKSFGIWQRSCLYNRTGFSSSSSWLCMLKGGNCVSPGCRCFDPVRLTFVPSQCCCLMHLPYRKGSAGSNTSWCCLLG